MDKNKNAIKQIKEGIKYYVNKMIENAPFDKTVNGYIVSIDNNLTYTVMINGKSYNNIRTISGTCQVGEVVKITIPQNNWSNMFILK